MKKKEENLKDYSDIAINYPLGEMKDGETQAIMCNEFEIRNTKGLIVGMKANMTVMELIKTAEKLKELSEELIVHLAEICGSCDDCSYCQEYEDYDEIIVPDYLLEEAGIPIDSKLCAYTEEDSGEITIVEADYDYDISDIPKFVIDIFEESGICIKELEERLIMEDIVYGEE